MRSNASFISYRRDVSKDLAYQIYLHLKGQNRDAFFDYQSLREGNWFETILRQIQARPYFILILAPGTLPRCTDPNDILRREIETAVNSSRKIIPIIVPQFDFVDLDRYLSEWVATKIKGEPAIKWPNEMALYDAAMAQLETYMPITDLISLFTVPTTDQPSLQKNLEAIEANLEPEENELGTVKPTSAQLAIRPQSVEPEARILAPLPILTWQLLWWICFNPAKYSEAQSINPNHVRRAAVWLTSILSWLPLIIPLSAGALGVFQNYISAERLQIYAIASIYAIAIVVFVDWLEPRNESSRVLAGCANIIEAIGLFVLYNVTIFIMGTPAIAILLTNLFVSVGIVSGLAVRRRKVFRYTVYVVLFLTVSLFTTMRVGCAAILGVPIIAFWGASRALGSTFNSAIKNGRPNIFTGTTFVLLLASYAFLIWYSYFDGYRALGR